MAFAAVIELNTLDGVTGFTFQGAATNQATGWSVASAGDVNGDGIDDLLIGSNIGNGNQRGLAYVVFGRSTPFNAIEALATLTPDKGFSMTGLTNYDRVGFAVSAAGDINHDGIDDFIIGTNNGFSTATGNRSGIAYIVFGADGLSSADLGALDGTSGFTFVGPNNYSYAGRTITALGDINGDGIDDIAFGANGADRDYDSRPGAAYVVFGSASGFAASLSAGSLNGTNGFKISGSGNAGLGYSISSAGDVNGDGLNDLIVGASTDGSYTGRAVIIFGSSTPFSAAIDMSTGAQLVPLQVSGQQIGRQVAGAGDINGDGFDDVMVASNYGRAGGSNTGTIYVVFGKASGWDTTTDLDGLNGSNGFIIAGADVEDLAGISISSAGDINDDGFDDILIGANKADPHGGNSGAAYLVFGKATGFGTLDLSNLDGTNGFKMLGGAFDAWAGRRVAAGGDINGDGVDDLVVSAPYNYNGGRGMTYVIYGQSSRVTFVGGNGNDNQTGGTGGDSLSGGGGNDTLNGAAGDDILDGGDLSDVLNGGDGADDLIGGSGGDILSGDAGDDSISGGIGADKLFGGDGVDTLDGGADNDRFDGGSGADILLGGAGNDYLDGGVGADSMTGGVGNDVFLVDDGDDTVIEAAGEGYDIVRSSVSIRVLAANVEAVELQGAADLNANGNGDANNLQGNTGSNQLSGGGGVDTINGNDGDDVVIGGTGNDLLRGGLGADSFRVLGESMGRPVLESDQIFDFSTAEGDIVDLSAIDANSLLDGNQAFSLVTAFSKQAGQMTMSFSGGVTLIRLDVNGDTKADYQLKINGDVTGDSGGWLL
ncbi:hypothetical protein [Caulobacter sp. NIBR1757]|uniref:hypothetical protein n=1 Tax=Caulobacter sp. NIBR1757 TaxID=3016000 RepID=UPI0022F0D31A|nr:hypothetical protein [Caulobacter sp. NIBR1757]WGM40487.1 hypothetical protein AMEJIAPC_03432 [Caulobacter sp. NIBR1757]